MKAVKEAFLSPSPASPVTAAPAAASPAASGSGSNSLTEDLAAKRIHERNAAFLKGLSGETAGTSAESSSTAQSDAHAAAQAGNAKLLEVLKTEDALLDNILKEQGKLHKDLLEILSLPQKLCNHAKDLPGTLLRQGLGHPEDPVMADEPENLLHPLRRHLALGQGGALVENAQGIPKAAIRLDSNQGKRLVRSQRTSYALFHVRSRLGRRQTLDAHGGSVKAYLVNIV